METGLKVRASLQSAELWKNGTLLKTYSISTARNGLGCIPESLCTPYGRLQIAQKIGDGEPLGRVFRDLNPTSEIWSVDPDNPIFHLDEDLVLSRIFRLAGAEDFNLSTLARNILMHGTNREGLLGTPDSGGSIRFSNDDILELFDHLQIGDLVEVH